jgi:hypothetical protein
MAREYRTETYTDNWPCANCGRQFFGTFVTRHPKYCDGCRVIVSREKARDRKRRQYERERARRDQRVTVRSFPLYTRISDDTFYVTFLGPAARKPISELFNIRAGL